MLKILTSPNPILSQKAKPVPTKSGTVSKVGKNILKLIEDLKEALVTAKDPIGVGLAAPQLGESLQIFITRPTSKSKIQVFINPKIKEYLERAVAERTKEFASARGVDGKVGVGPRAKKADSSKLEGCLSLPNIWGKVERDSLIKLSYLDQKGKAHTQTFSGFMATIIQHELDHLDGILFPKRVLLQKGKLYKSHKDEKGEDVFEEIEL